MFVNTYNKTDVAAPFGGFKMSGFGKDLGKWQWNRGRLEGGREGVHSWLDRETDRQIGRQTDLLAKKQTILSNDNIIIIVSSEINIILIVLSIIAGRF